MVYFLQIWFENEEFSGDRYALACAAFGGNAKALVMMFMFASKHSVMCDHSADAWLEKAIFSMTEKRAIKEAQTEAQYKLGNMHHKGLIRDDHKMRYGVRCIRRAARSGRPEAIKIMEHIRSCVNCGANNAPFACGLCQQMRRCDYDNCCPTHWRVGDSAASGAAYAVPRRRLHSGKSALVPAHLARRRQQVTNNNKSTTTSFAVAAA